MNYLTAIILFILLLFLLTLTVLFIQGLKQKKRYTWLLLLIIIPLCFVFILCNLSLVTIFDVRNDYKLQRYEEAMRDLEIPPGSEQIGKVKGRFGNLGPTGNYCDFGVSKIIQTDLTLSEVNSFYKNLGYYYDPNILTLGTGFRPDNPKVRIFEIDTISNYEQDYAIDSKDIDPNSNLYLISGIERNKATMDIRCN